MVMTVDCPSCATSFPVDPAKVPEAGVNARCTVCAEIFRVERPSDDAAEASVPGAAPASQADTESRVQPEVAGPAPDGGWDSLDSSSDDGWDGSGADDDFATDDDFGAVATDAVEEADDDWVVETEDDAEEATADSDDAFFGAAGGGAATDEAVADDAAFAFEDEDEGQEEEEEEPSGEAPSTLQTDAPVQGFSFEERDPSDKARRLARVLVSDMIMYNPERHQRALENGTLEDDFEEEIDKSWKEYVEQVGEEMAESTDYWTEALNDILAKGDEVF